MLKILYAAANNENAKIQLARFISEMSDKSCQIKIAAYRKSSPNINIDWTLDCLMNIFKPEHISLDNENFITYYHQVKDYNPDLIISDLEYFTSYIANQLNIELWQCSSSLINFTLTQEQKYNLGLFKKYYYLFHKVPLNNQRILNMIDISTHNFIYSYLGDTKDPPRIYNNFEWIRPYHSIGKQSILCKHNIIAAMLHPNKKILDILNNYSDCVVFSEFCEEEYTNILLKDIYNHQEYTCNLHNSNLFMCEGSTSFLADAFYNGKFSIVLPNIHDTECVINSVFAEHAGISKTIYNGDENLSSINNSIVSSCNNIQYLHERVMEKCTI